MIPNPHTAPATLPKSSSAERLWSAINQHPRATLLAPISLYLLVTVSQAAAKLLWTDELITLAIARQGSLPAIWHALAAGGDPNPPLSHTLVLLSTRLFGQSALAIRLPSIVCMLLALLSLWSILRPWLNPAYAALGVLAFMTTRGFDYAYDARSYAPLAGFTMAALALWFRRTDPPLARSTNAAALAAALALSVSSNYYGALAFILIAAAELTRTIHARRLDPPVWLALSVGALPLLAYRSLIRHNLAEFGPHAWNRPRVDLLSDSYLILVEGLLWPVLLLAAVALFRRRPRTLVPQHSLAPHELTALAILIAYPILGYLMALGGHAMISPRCVIPVCCGFAMAAALLAHRTFAANPRSGLVLLAFALTWVIVRESACAWVLHQQRSGFLALCNAVAAEPSGRPILLADSSVALPLAHYSTPAVRDRLLFPIDFSSIHQYESDDSGEQNLWAANTIPGLYPIRIIPYHAALFAAPALTVIARPEGWLAHRLTADGYQLTANPIQPAWDSLGGIFTPMAHPETRLLTATHP